MRPSNIFIFALLLFSSVFNFVFSQPENFESSYLLSSIDPNDEGAFWFPKNTEVQGVANDGKNWFITTTGHTDASGPDYWAKLWKIPLSVPLGNNSNSDSRVRYVEMFDIPQLNFPANPYWHWGDPDSYIHNGKTYILVPIYPIEGTGIIACFDASNLKFTGFAGFELRPGWCAIDNEGFLYSSKNHASNIKKFKVDWDDITTGVNSQVLKEVSEIELKFLTGSDYDFLEHMQGGEFSDSNEMIYLVSGSAGCHGSGPNSGDPDPSDGIHAFTTHDWKEVEFSRKNGGYFHYGFENNCEGFFGTESPEGLTYWDISEKGLDNISGQLHVLIFHWDLGRLGGANHHDVSMAHFQKEVYVNNTIEEEDLQPSLKLGNRSNPFSSFFEAFYVYPIWSGAEIVLKNGVYSDTGVYNQRVLISSEGGSAVIGKQN